MFGKAFNGLPHSWIEPSPKKRQRAIETPLSLSQANPPVEAAFQIVDILPLSFA
jgi:hypothetical protein